MKRFIPAMLAVAISLVPLGASAGEPPASAPGGPMPPMMMFQDLQLTQSQQQAARQIMEQTHQQMETLHAQARARILGSLTPAHRQLLAQIAGNLAIAPNPDPDAAARQLDAALSPAEAQAVVSAHTAAKNQMHAIMESAHQRFQALLTPDQRAKLPDHAMGGHHMMMMDEHGGFSQMTAGHILLHITRAAEEHMHMMGMDHM